MTNQSIYQIALTMINGVGDILARHLLEHFSDAESVFREKLQHLEKVHGIGRILAGEIKKPEVLKRAEKELSFVEKNNISYYFLPDEKYPRRLRECPDAPVLFYYKGNANLNAQRIISIVGTRKATAYGRSLTERLIHGLAGLFPDTLILSGLAYGIDVQAHRSALKEQLPTVAVLAHGLDRIYPSAHRAVAVEMLEHGGLLTDFPSETNPDKQNFLKRNRIVAGLSDATVVVESGEWGGSLVTADIAFSYSREVFTFPGRVDDLSSAGCNQLIKKNKAGLITSSADLVEALGWGDRVKRSNNIIQTNIIFPENSAHKMIVDTLREHEEIHINQLAARLDMPVSRLSALLFEMEMDQIITSHPGNIYKLA